MTQKGIWRSKQKFIKYFPRSLLTDSRFFSDLQTDFYGAKVGPCFVSTSTSWLRLLSFWTKINFKKNNFLAKHSTFLDLQSNCWNKKRTVFEFAVFFCWNSESLKFFWKVDEILRVSILNIFPVQQCLQLIEFLVFLPNLIFLQKF